MPFEYIKYLTILLGSINLYETTFSTRKKDKLQVEKRECWKSQDFVSLSNWIYMDKASPKGDNATYMMDGSCRFTIFYIIWGQFYI